MKKFAIAIIIIFVAANLMGQSVNRQNLSLSIGASMPQSDFRKDLINDSTSGFAKTGVALEFNYMYRLTHNFGLQLMISYSSNAMDNIKYRNALELEHPDYGVSVESNKNWTSGGIFLGPYVRLPLNSKLSWDIRALAGYMGAYTPSITVRAAHKENPNDKLEHYLVSSRATSFGYALGTGFKYRVRSDMYVLLFGDYFNTTMKFKDVSGWDWDSEPYSDSFNQKITYFSVTLGIGYIL